MTSKQKIPSLLPITLYEQFACLCVERRQAESDRLEAAIKRNLEALGYGE